MQYASCFSTQVKSRLLIILGNICYIGSHNINDNAFFNDGSCWIIIWFIRNIEPSIAAGYHRFQTSKSSSSCYPNEQLPTRRRPQRWLAVSFQNAEVRTESWGNNKRMLFQLWVVKVYLSLLPSRYYVEFHHASSSRLLCHPLFIDCVTPDQLFSRLDHFH